MATVTVKECESCGRKYGENHKATMKRPSLEELEEMVSNGVAEATDGCSVEPDGECEHGHQSWLRQIGVI